MNRRTVVFAPAHYFTGENVGGSEYSWVYELVMALALEIASGAVFTGELKNGKFPENVTLHEIWKARDVDFDRIFPRFEFLWNYWRAVFLVEPHPEILHHVLPFSSETFNPLVLLKGLPLGIGRKTKVVIGPIQTPHEIEFHEGDVSAILNRRARTGEIVECGRTVESARGLASPILRILHDVARALSRRTLDRADAIVAITPDAKTMLERRGVRAPIFVIPAGVRLASFPYHERVNTGRCLRLLSSCYLLKRKGVDLILMAVAQLVSRGVNVELVIVGDGPERRHLEDFALQLDITAVVTFAGYIDHARLLPYYVAADVWVSMSWAESFGVSLLEAMSTGMPVVTAANLGAKAILREKQAGVLIELGDSLALAHELERLGSSAALRAELGMSGRKLVEEDFDWAVIAEKYADVYEFVTTPKQREPRK